MCAQNGILKDMSVGQLTVLNAAHSDFFLLPYNLEANVLGFGGGETVSFKPTHFRSSVRDNITQLSLSSSSFAEFKTMDVSKYKFTSLLKFKLQCDHMEMDERETMPYILELMPNLVTLELRNSPKPMHYDIPPSCPLLFTPQHMGKVRRLILEQAYLKFDQCSFPRLEYLELRAAAVISHWGTLTKELKEIKLIDSPLRSILELIKPKVAANLSNVKKLTIKEYVSTDLSSFFVRGHFNKIMPNLEEFEILSHEDVTPDTLNKFIDSHPRLRKISARGQDALSAEALQRPLEELVTDFESDYEDEDEVEDDGSDAGTNYDEYDEKGFSKSDYLDDDEDDDEDMMKAMAEMEDDYIMMNLHSH